MIRGLCALLLTVVVVAGCTTDNGGLILKDLAPLAVPAADPALAELLPDDIRERGAVTAGSPLSSQPLYFRTGDTGEPTGLTVDFVSTASAILGLRVEWLQLPYAGLPPALLSRKIDVAAAQFSPTPENLKAINVISLYRTATSVLTLRSGGPEIEEPLDACGLAFAITAGSKPDAQAGEQIGEICAEAGLTKPTVEGYPTLVAGLTAVRARRVDGFIEPTPVALYERDKGDVYEVRLESQFGERITGFGLPLDDPELTNAYKAAFDKMVADGTYLEILRRWSFESLKIDKPVLNGETK
ncbi:amino acid ABC transporter substrate-binding protein (PAAT family) [Williamsia limnetica]|uniref:Amino acid ABC transporter substrate-binding protein (PAAT family) n=1 Tax=Williamsia limnetica TaxID=882452 RepID=A0A318RMB0_WILLI|nr:transporter substrate-binding domain-containing protein [Williamsia limnetica]PYE12320.1 amino acid ABC transporter substrate-binding protein (PAAT family) [Williamsia limnetica]